MSKIRKLEFEKMFSKQHFEKIACLTRNSKAQTKNEFALELVKLFQADNPKFKTQKFLLKSGLVEIEKQ